MTTLPLERPDAFQPPPAYPALRASAPTSKVLTPDGAPAWLVTSRASVAVVLADPRFGISPPGTPAAGMGSLFTDGEPHARLRRLLAHAFTARRITALRTGIADIADRLVAGLKQAGPGSDLLVLVARPLSLAVIGEILGVAEADRQRFGRWADASLGVLVPDPLDPAAKQPGAEQAWGELSGFIAELIAAKRARPGEDLLSVLVGISDQQDGRLSDDELLTTTVALLAAGYLTIANALTIGLAHLLPTGLLGTLVDEQRAATAVEEMLRKQTGRSGEAMPRWAQVDVELDGQQISAGELVLARLEAANHDPAEFTDPDRFELTREPNRHLSFGHGAHHCLGAALARIELAEALRALAEALPTLELAGKPEDLHWLGSPLDDGLIAFPVTW
ncbi:MAG TPA: cytochrome P450 [Pseudonocardiaceae bacterium]|nr:cytochrome P450 [Pseudonocardiaceae bacterium]